MTYLRRSISLASFFGVYLFALSSASAGLSQDKAPVTPPFSPVIEANGVLYLAGALGILPDTRDFAEGGIKGETRQALENIGRTLASVDASHKNIVRCQVFLADIADFADMNAVYRTFFPQNPPARTTVAVKGLALNAKIEIECTAVRGHGETHDTGE